VKNCSGTGVSTNDDGREREIKIWMADTFRCVDWIFLELAKIFRIFQISPFLEKDSLDFSCKILKKTLF
jgi:hypothetical protein